MSSKKEIKKTNTLKFDYCNPESQKLFEEFTKVLGDMTKFIESRDKQLDQKNSEIIELSEKQKELMNKQEEMLATLELLSSGRYIAKVLFNKLIYRVFAIVKYIPKKIKNKIRDIFK